MGLVIRDQRRKQGLTQADLARRIGVGRQWLVAVEQGKPGAEIGLILRALAALGIALSTGSAPTDASNGSAAIEIDAIVEAAQGGKQGGRQ